MDSHVVTLLAETEEDSRVAPFLPVTEEAGDKPQTLHPSPSELQEQNDHVDLPKIGEFTHVQFVFMDLNLGKLERSSFYRLVVASISILTSG